MRRILGRTMLGVWLWCASSASAQSLWDTTVSASDGTSLAVTWICPAGEAPVIVLVPGWSTNRLETLALFANLLLEGYGLVSMDPRGFGTSEGYAFIPDRQGADDLSRVLDWIHDELPCATLQPETGLEKDILVGTAGLSYGGAYPLLGATFDRRIDAIAAMSTYHSLLEALAPNGVPKSYWFNLLIALGTVTSRIDPRLLEWTLETNLTNEVPEDAADAFLAGSLAGNSSSGPPPAVLLGQGMTDGLFGWSQGAGNFRWLRERGAPVQMVGYLGGLSHSHFEPQISHPLGEPCGSFLEVIPRWFRRHLRNDPSVDVGPAVQIATDDGLTCLQSDSLPVNHTTLPVASSVTLLPLIGSVTVPFYTSRGTNVVWGAPQLSLRNTSLLGDDDIFFVSVVVLPRLGLARVVDTQVTPIRVLQARQQRRTYTLEGIAVTLHDGDRLALRFRRIHELFPLSFDRTPGLFTARDVEIKLAFR